MSRAAEARTPARARIAADLAARQADWSAGTATQAWRAALGTDLPVQMPSLAGSQVGGCDHLFAGRCGRKDGPLKHRTTRHGGLWDVSGCGQPVVLGKAV
jgi:hypothetical protein